MSQHKGENNKNLTKCFVFQEKLIVSSRSLSQCPEGKGGGGREEQRGGGESCYCLT